MPSAPSPSVVAVVVTSLDGWRDSITCLDSLAVLQYPNVEIVLVDNASPDGSVERIAEAHPNVRLLRSDANLGITGGNNIGIRYGLDRGAEYVWLLNNDTRVAPDSLEAMVREATRDPRAAAVGCVLYLMESPDRIQAWGGGWVNLWTGLSRHAKTPTVPDKLSYLTFASALIRTQALREVGLLDEGFFIYWEDVDLSFRLRRAGWRLAVAPDAKVWHVESGTVGRRTVRGDATYVASAKRLFHRYAPVPMAPIFIALVGRFVNRVRRGEWAQARAVWRALRSPSIRAAPRF
jgi:GT2 family glycosyltransferase